MTDKKSIESRRKLLKSIAAGSGAIVAGKSLPDSWSRPVVDSVMLPAHAMTSSCGTLTITSITPISGGASAPPSFTCGGTTPFNLNFNFNVAPVPPAGTTVTLTSGCATASPAAVDGSGNATMDVDLGSCAGEVTLEFSIGCGSSVSCVVFVGT